MRSSLILFLLCLLVYRLPAQTDSTRLSYDDFYHLVLANHPVVKQARLLPEEARAQLRTARGGFDPKAGLQFSRKRYDGKTYYHLFDAGLKIPVWFPIDAEAGITRNSGEYLNPEHYISADNAYTQVYAGITVPLGRGLFTDDRRANVKQALIFTGLSEMEQIKAINKILLQASKDYWSWFYAYNTYQFMQSNVSIAEDIFKRTRLGFAHGEVAAMDTVQAGITLLQRRNDLAEARIDFAVAALTLSNHLWDEEGRPLELAPETYPQEFVFEAVNTEEFGTLLAYAQENHPEIRTYVLKQESLQVDRALARENLKPVLNLKYHLLDQPWNFEGNRSTVDFGDNFRFGLDVHLPLFLRKERGKLSQVNLKLSQNVYAQEFAGREIINRISASYVKLTNMEFIIEQQAVMVAQYEMLLRAERFNLENGESDLFKINIQWEKLIDSRTKLIKSQAEYRKALAEFYWSTGRWSVS